MDIDALYVAVEERLHATDLAGAGQLLERASTEEDLTEEEADDLLPLWEELADAYAERQRFDEAIATLRRCSELSGEGGSGLRAAMAGYTFRAGREDEARAEWEALRAEDPRDVVLHFTAGLACADADEAEEALPWLTRALELVVKHGDREGLLADLLELREEVLGDAGEEIDDLQQRGEALLERQLRQFSGDDTVAQRREPAKTALAWFPESEWDAAVQRWPDVTESTGSADYREYVTGLQQRLVELQREGAARLSLAPLFLEAYVTWAEARELDPAEGETRATYAAEVARLGNEVPWPPGRNDPCWCGSGAKYKKCCARAAR